MFGEIELRSYRVEVLLENFVVKAKLRPRGELIAYLNDRNWSFIPLQNAELHPLPVERKVGGLRQTLTVVNKYRVGAISVVDEEEAEQIVLPAARRATIFYLDKFAVQGYLHVSADAPDEDLMDEMHDFFPVTAASVYPLHPVATEPKRDVPLLLISRRLVQAYQVRN